MRFACTLLFCLFPYLLAAQISSKHDSLQSLIHQTEDDSIRALHYLSLGDLYQYNRQDTALHYYHKALDLAQDAESTALEGKCYNYIGIIYLYRSEYDPSIRYLKKSIDLKRQARDTGGIANGYNNLGIIFKNRGAFGKAQEAFRKVATLRQKLSQHLTDSMETRNNIHKTGQAYINLGNVYFQFGNYSEAVKSYQKSLILLEQIGNEKAVAACYNNMGNVFEEQQQYHRALEYYRQALEVNQNLGEIRNIGTCLNNIGEIYLKRNDLKKARELFQRSLEYREQVGDKRGISAVFSNLALSHMKVGNHEKARHYLTNALKLDYEVGDKKGTAKDLNYMARLNLNENHPDKAINYAEEARILADSIEAHLQKRTSLELLARGYEKKGNYKKALEYTRMFEDVDDYLFNKRKNRQIEELETRYRVEKKQEEIEKQEMLINRKEKVIQQQKTLSYAFVAGFILMVTLLLLVYLIYRQKRRSHRRLMIQKEEIEAKNEELQQQNEEITSQRDELEHQINIARNQRNEIEEKKDEISSGIRYARSIQSAVMPSKHTLEHILPGYFILFRPMDIVSGDFYWVRECEGKVGIAVVDCTGHGVSSAFMSLLVINLLNEIFSGTDGLDAGKMLDRLRMRLVRALRREAEKKVNTDDMQMSLCIWDRTSHTLQLAGAYNSLYLVRGGELHEYKADRMTLGIGSELHRTFTNHPVDLQPGDTLYMFTDGFPDQLSGDSLKKLTHKRFRETLVANANLPMEEQKKSLERLFDQWRKGYEQIDDVLVMGIRF